MEYTENYGLLKPDENDLYNIEDYKNNLDVIDTELSKRLTDTGDVSNTKTTFTPASTLDNVTSGEKLNISLGKISKAITSFISHLSNKVNPHEVTKSQIGLDSVDNTSDVNKPVSKATQTALNNKVDKVSGKGLSTNDYTTTEKSKLEGIEDGANKYTHPNSGVTAGTYRSVTVNAQGHVTSGSNPTITVAQGGTGKTTSADAMNSFINALSTGDSTPQDADYFISQYAGGGTTNTTYHRRPFSALWAYIKSKADSTYAKSSHGTHVSYGTSASALGTSSAGSASTVSRSDHVHALPALTSCTGTLSVAKGGSGATTAKGAEYNLIGGISETTTALSDNAFAVFRYTSPSSTQGVLLYKKVGLFWDYIVSKITGAISSVLTSNLTASRALVSNSSGKIAVSAVTSTELGYLDGVTSAIQTQLNGKANYEEGTCTLYVGKSTQSGTWVGVDGRYIKVGKLCYVFISTTITTLNSTEGYLCIRSNSLPFTKKDLHSVIGSVKINNAPTGGTIHQIVQVGYSDTAGIITEKKITNGFPLQISFIYEIA